MEHQKFSCDQCDYKGKYKADLSIHWRSYHVGEMFPCDQCDFRATRRNYLRIHIKSKHEG